MGRYGDKMGRPRVHSEAGFPIVCPGVRIREGAGKEHIHGVHSRSIRRESLEGSLVICNVKPISRVVLLNINIQELRQRLCSTAGTKERGH